MRRLSDEFLRAVVAEYRGHVGRGGVDTRGRRSQRPAAAIAEAEGVPVKRVHYWILQARRRGLMPAADTPGRADDGTTRCVLCDGTGRVSR